MRRRRCLDHDCPKNKDSTLCERRPFYNHVLTIPKKKLIEIFALNNLVKYPEFLSLLTLVNLYIDFSTEPIASQIIDGGKR